MITFIIFPLGCQFVVGIVFQLLESQVPLIFFLFQVFLEQKQRFIKFAHVLFFALDAGLFFFFNGFVGFLI